MKPRSFGTVILFHNGYGDYVMALPTLRALCALAPRPIALIVGDGPHLFLLDTLAVDLLIVVPFVYGWPRKNFSSEPVFAEVRDCTFFISLCPYECDGQDKLLDYLPAQHQIGFGVRFPRSLDYAAPGHEIEILFQAARLIADDPTLTVAAFGAPIAFRSSTDVAAIIAQMHARLGPRSLALAVHLATRPDKLFPATRFDRVLEQCLYAEPTLVAFVIDAPRQAFPGAAQTGRCVFVNRATLERSMAVVASCDALIAVDSCMLHVGDLARLPGIGLFGPTNPARYGFFWTSTENARHLRAEGAPSALPDGAIKTAAHQLLGLLANTPRCRDSCKVGTQKV